MDLTHPRCSLTGRMVLAAVSLALPVLAQQPDVVSVENALPSARLSPGIQASIYGNGLSGGTVTVEVGGHPAPVLERRPYGDDGIADLLRIQIPTELSPGSTNVVVRKDGVGSAPYNIVLDRYSPAFDPRTLERSSAGTFIPFECSPSHTPRAGDIGRIYVGGLGPTDLPVATGAPAPLGPLANTLVKPAVFVGGQSAEVTESVLAPGEIGVYRVSFKIPQVEGLEGLSLVVDELVITQMLPVGNALSSLTPAAAPESITTVAACGGSLTTVVPAGASQIVADGDPQNPPSSLGGTTIVLKDSKGVERPAAMLHVDPIRTSYIVPSGMANGDASVKVTAGDGAVSTGTIRIQNVSPKLYYDSYYPSTPAGAILRIHDGVQTIEPLVVKSASGQPIRVPIDLGPETDQVFLVMFGTGWRFRSSAEKVRVTVQPSSAPGKLTYAGAQGTFAGLDQINFLLPRTLAGLGLILGSVYVEDETALSFSLIVK